VHSVRLVRRLTARQRRDDLLGFLRTMPLCRADVVRVLRGYYGLSWKDDREAANAARLALAQVATDGGR
jgi:hypothetical protein